MLGLGGSSPVAGQADDVINCPISKAYEVIGKNFFDNYPKWCPQIVELEQISPSPIGPGTKGRQVTRDRGIDSESIFEFSKFVDDSPLFTFHSTTNASEHRERKTSRVHFADNTSSI